MDSPNSRNTKVQALQAWTLLVNISKRHPKVQNICTRLVHLAKDAIVKVS